MEQVQQKRGLRIVAAIMFIAICVVEIISNIRFMSDNSWMFSGSGAARNIISRIAGDLIYSIAIFAMMAAGLFAKKKSNGLRFAFGGLFAALLAAEIICLIGEISFENALRIYWSEFVMLIAAAAVLFAVKRISLVGVGFSMLAWIRLMSVIHYIEDDADAEYIIFTLVILIAMALAAVVCFLNDSEKRRGAAIPLGIIAIVFISIWYIYVSARNIDTLSRYTSTNVVLNTLFGLFSALFLFLGTLFAMIAIAFRKKVVPAKSIAYQQPQSYQVPPQYGQPYQQQWQPPQPQYQPVPPQPAQQWQQPQYQPVPPQPQQYAQQWQPPQPQYQQPPMKQQTPVQQPTEFPPKEASEEVWTCPVCGTVSPKSAKFCMNCGTKQE